MVKLRARRKKKTKLVTRWLYIEARGGYRQRFKVSLKKLKKLKFYDKHTKAWTSKHPKKAKRMWRFSLALNYPFTKKYLGILFQCWVIHRSEDRDKEIDDFAISEIKQMFKTVEGHDPDTVQRKWHKHFDWKSWEVKTDLEVKEEKKKKKGKRKYKEEEFTGKKWKGTVGGGWQEVEYSQELINTYEVRAEDGDGETRKMKGGNLNV